VITDNLLEASSQRINIQPPVKLDADRNIVKRIVWLELIQKPESLLGIRERQQVVFLSTRDRG
jgi:hypothetical protein